MAGYWPRSFLLVFMDRDGVKVHNLARKERGQYPAILTEQTWPIKGLLYGFRGDFSCGIRRVVPSGESSRKISILLLCHSSKLNQLYLSHVPRRLMERLMKKKYRG